IIEETVDSTTVIKNGKVETEGFSFDNVPTKLTFLDNQEIQFNLKFQSYSEYHTYIIYLQADPDGPHASYGGALISTYQSSDGDGFLHPQSMVLSCTVTR